MASQEINQHLHYRNTRYGMSLFQNAKRKLKKSFSDVEKDIIRNIDSNENFLSVLNTQNVEDYIFTTNK